MRKTLRFLAACCICACNTAAFSQTAITAANTTATAATSGTTYNANGAPNSTVSGVNYDYRYGTSSGIATSKVFLNNFVAGSNTYYFDYGMAINVVLNRVNNASVTGQRDLIYNEGTVNTGTTPNQINVGAPYVTSMSTLFIGNDDMRSGTDNLFCNQGNSDGDQNNIERLDVRINGNNGYIVGDPTKEGFVVFERGAAGAHDAFTASVITGLSSGNPSAYQGVLRLTSASYGATNPLADGDFNVLRKDAGATNLQYAVKINTQGIGGIFFKFSDFGIAAGTHIYGYSLTGSDFPAAAAASAMADYTNATNFPTTTGDGAAGGGIDMAAITGLFKIFNDDLDGIPNNIDVDDDNDGILDVTENGGVDPFGDADNDNMLNYVDPTPGAGLPAFVDSNSDGVNDAYDADKDGLVNQIDLDSDNDGIPDIVEAGGVDTNGDGMIDGTIADNDGDGLMNAYDASTGGVNIANLDTDGDGIKNFLDLDSDNDGIPDVVEAGGVDTDGDGRLDNTVNADNDGFSDVVDGNVGNNGAANNTANALMVTGADGNSDGKPDTYPQGINNTDGRGLPNPYDLDSDDDGIADVIEAGGTDANNDGKLDYVGTFAANDTDSDGFLNSIDGDANNDGTAENTANALIPTGADSNSDGKADSYAKANADGSGMPNPYDLDSDNDGVPDLIESGGKDTDGDGRIDVLSDADGNGWQNSYDPTQSGINIKALDANGATTGGSVFDFDGDGIANYLDLDSDNDGIPDIIEQEGTDSNNDGKVDPATDIDNDGFIDTVDPLNNSTGAALGTAIITTGSTLSSQNIPTTYSAGDDLDAKGLINMLDLDADGDGILDVREAGLTDTNSDGLADGTLGSDGWSDTVDALASLTLTNSDAQGKPNYLDIDADNDGIVDNIEGQSTAGYAPPANADADGDGIDDTYDTNDALFASNIANGIIPVNTDGTDTPDYIDLDADNDGYNDRIEGWDTNGNNAIHGAEIAYVGTSDADGDGLFDEYDVNDAATNPTNGTTPASYPNVDKSSTTERDWREASDVDGDGVADNVDVDDDNDGVTDLAESGNVNPLGDADGDGTLNYLDPTPGAGVPVFADANNDSIADAFDKDRDGIINAFDLDSDNDGIPDITEAGGYDGDNNGVVDNFLDTNGNGLTNAYDPASSGTALANADTDGDGVVNALDLDSDNDGVPDLIESGGKDTDGDGRIDVNSDADGNGWQNSYDPTQSGINLRTLDANGATAGGLVFDFDGDGIANYVDLDSDNDGIPDIVEQGGADTNNDGKVDAATDADNDGFIDTVDPLNNTTAAALGTAIITTGSTLSAQNIPTTYSSGDNLDGKELINMLDLDADEDGILDTRESGLAGDTNNDGVIKSGDTGFTDANSDGWADAIDALASLNLANTDSRGSANYLDIDADDDGLTDNVEGQPTATYQLPSGADNDVDGIDDNYDNNDVAFGGNANNGITPNNHDGTDNPDYTDTDSDNDGANDLKEGSGNGAATLTNTTDTDGDGLVDQFDTFNMNTQTSNLQNNVTLSGMGNNGTTPGPSPAGSNLLAYKSTVGAPNRDWRNNLIVLPVTFLSINATLQSATTAVVRWTVAQEQGVLHYEIERSIDGGVFTAIGSQNVGGTGAVKTYAYTDNTVQGNTISYRIKQISDNRTFSYSAIVRLTQHGAAGLTLYPNPVNNNVALQFYSRAAQQGLLVFSDASGRTLISQAVAVQKGFNSYTTAAVQRFSSGVYTVRLYVDGTWQYRQFVKQ